jgi:hypothetical protein
MRPRRRGTSEFTFLRASVFPLLCLFSLAAYGTPLLRLKRPSGPASGDAGATQRAA